MGTFSRYLMSFYYQWKAFFRISLSIAINPYSKDWSKEPYLLNAYLMCTLKCSPFLHACQIPQDSRVKGRCQHVPTCVIGSWWCHVESDCSYRRCQDVPTCVIGWWWCHVESDWFLWKMSARTERPVDGCQVGDGKQSFNFIPFFQTKCF